MKKSIVFTVFLFGCICSCCAQFNKLDPAFGKKGIITEELGIDILDSYGRKVLVQPDGSIYLICGFRDGNYIAKRHPDGSPDSTYGLNGFSVIIGINDIDIADAALSTDGKIVVAGNTHGYDSTNRDVYRFVLARFNADGSMDSNFAVNGKQETDFGSRDSKVFAIGIQKDGKIVAAGVTNNGDNYDVAVARYTIQGNLDETFSDDGRQFTSFGTGDDYAYSLAIASDGKIVIAGYTVKGGENDFAIARYTANGELDKTFSEDGKQTTDFGGTDDKAYSVAIQSNGKIVVLGVSSSKALVLAEYNTDGNLEKDFSGDGKLITQFKLLYSVQHVLALQTDGKIVIIGGGYYIVRYNINGSIDTTFSKEGIKFNTGVINSLAIQNDNKLVLTGEYSQCGDVFCLSLFSLARFNSAGEPDTTFGKNGLVTDGWSQGYTEFTASVIQKDGKIVTLGSTYIVGLTDEDTSMYVLARYTSGGRRDSTFSGDGIRTFLLGSEYGTPISLAVQDDGKILITGMDGSRKVLARFNEDGSTDSSFNRNGKQAFNVLTDYYSGQTAIQHGGKIVIAGSIDGNFALVRFNPDGSPDSTFGTGGKQETIFHNLKSEIRAVAVQKNNKIVVAGRIFTDDYPYATYFAVARYTVNGSLDKSFSGDGIDTLSFGYYNSIATSIAIQADGKIIVAGTGSPSFGSQYYFTIARYNTDGSRDSTFSGDGLQTTAFGSYYGQGASIALQSNGRILVGSTDAGTFAGNNTKNYMIASYAPDGILDTIFSGPYDGLNHLLNQISVVNNQLYITGSTSVAVVSGNDGVIARYLLNNKITAPPMVILTSPADNTIFPAGGNLLIKADASAAGVNKILKVEFYSDTTLLYTAIDTPYVYKWPNVPAGKYTFTARATDDSGRFTKSAPVYVLVTSNLPPLVNITRPADSSNYFVNWNITLSAHASDPDGAIRSVDFYIDNTLLFTEKKPPYSVIWSDYRHGDYVITAVATDNEGRTTTSAPVHITLQFRPPSVSLTSPVDSATYTAPATIVISANAKGHLVDGDKITRVKFFNGTTLLHIEENAPYTWEWKNVPPGQYTITANATDAYNLTNTSKPVMITVTPPGLSMAGGSQSNSSVNTTGYTKLKMQLSPNPAKNTLKINITGGQKNIPSVISLISASGVLMQTRQIKNLSQIQFDISSLPGGTYMIKFESGGNVINKLFVKT